MSSGLRELEEYLGKQVAALRRRRGASEYEDGLHDGFERALVMAQVIREDVENETIDDRIARCAGLG